jgi:asparagine synthetase B (glutamine-hydrolysing)
MRSIFGIFGDNIQQSDSFLFSEKNLSIGYQGNEKFKDDCIVSNTEKHILILDGVIFNKSELLEGKTLSWEDYFVSNFLDDPTECLQRLRGEFSGCFYDKQSNKLWLFNNPTNTKQIFYFQHQETFLFASDAKDLIELLNTQQLDLQLNPDAFYSFLAYGGLLQNTHWIKGAQKLTAGSILSIRDNRKIEYRYKSFLVSENEKTKEEYLDLFDQLITQAVKREWEKDIEYNYKHFSTLSGGLDSRVNVMLARKLGFTKQTNFCCSQKEYDDHKTSKKMAADFGHKYYFHALDKAEHIFKEKTLMTDIGGSVDYMGPAHLKFGLQKYWNSEFGIIHSGQVGDGVLGGFVVDNKVISPQVNYGRVSYSIFPKNEDFENRFTTLYSSDEEFKLYERAFSITNAGFWINEDLSYYSSPFLDSDVLDLLMGMPYSIKNQGLFYLEWMNRFHPEMTQYPWETIKSRPNALWKKKYAKWWLRLRFGWRKILSPSYRLKSQMTPEQYWFNTNVSIQEYYRVQIQNGIKKYENKDIPYWKEILNYSESKDIGLLSKLNSIFWVLDKIYSSDD